MVKQATTVVLDGPENEKDGAGLTLVSVFEGAPKENKEPGFIFNKGFLTAAVVEVADAEELKAKGTGFDGFKN